MQILSKVGIILALDMQEYANKRLAVENIGKGWPITIESKVVHSVSP